MEKTNQNGFSPVMIILLVVLIGVIGATGYYVYQTNNKTSNELSNSVDTSSGKKDTKPSVTATPIASATASWQTYSNKDFNFSFKYPSNVTVTTKKDANFAKDSKGTVLIVSAQKIADLPEATMGYDKETAANDLAALKKGDPSVSQGMTVKGSNKVINVLGGYGKVETLLSELDHCNVEYKRLGVFYKDDTQVIIDYRNFDVATLETADAKYFTTSAECSGKAYKDAEAVTTYYADLAAGKTDTLSQKWFTDFDKVISTFKFN